MYSVDEGSNEWTRLKGGRVSYVRDADAGS